MIERLVAVATRARIRRSWPELLAARAIAKRKGAAPDWRKRAAITGTDLGASDRSREAENN